MNWIMHWWPVGAVLALGMGKIILALWWVSS